MADKMADVKHYKHAHSAAYKGCQTYKTVIETLKVQATQGLSWRDAVKAVKIQEREIRNQTQSIYNNEETEKMTKSTKHARYTKGSKRHNKEAYDKKSGENQIFPHPDG